MCGRGMRRGERISEKEMEREMVIKTHNEGDGRGENGEYGNHDKGRN